MTLRKQLLSISGLLMAVQPVNAGKNSQPFEGITRLNAFRLSTSTQETRPNVPVVGRPQVILQGITTLMGHAQVLLSIQKPGSTGVDGVSCVMTEGECQYNMTVLEINSKTGSVRLRNTDMEQTLRLGL